MCADERYTSAVDLDRHDWERLARLRLRFLGEGGAGADYWTALRDLEIYDATFGARIGWKWRAVTDELLERGCAFPEGDVLDFGCGTGVAARVFLEAFPRPSGSRLALVERSRLARRYARELVRAQTKEIVVEEVEAFAKERPAVLLVSHVLGELDAPAREALLALARRSRTILWIEPGSRSVSRSLSEVRDSLRAEFDVLAPCPHAAACGALASGSDEEWCHFFAEPAVEAFQSKHWAIFSRTLGIDLRSLSYAYLLLRSKDESGPPLAPLLRPRRLLGRVRILKGHARVRVCDETGVREQHLLKREDPELFRRLRRGDPTARS